MALVSWSYHHSDIPSRMYTAIVHFSHLMFHGGSQYFLCSPYLLNIFICMSTLILQFKQYFVLLFSFLLWLCYELWVSVLLHSGSSSLPAVIAHRMQWSTLNMQCYSHTGYMAVRSKSENKNKKWRWSFILFTCVTIVQFNSYHWYHTFLHKTIK